MTSETLNKDFDRDGYVILRNIVPQPDLKDLREYILAAFKIRFPEKADQDGWAPQTHHLILTDLLNMLPKAMAIQFSEPIVAASRQLFGDEFRYVNDISIQRNQKIVALTGGWHIDAGSNFGLRYLNDALGVKQYRFAKIGVYLQAKESPFGGSINVIPGSHRLGRTARGILLRALEQRRIGKLDLGKYCSVSVDEHIQPGDCVIFDCRLVHRSSRGDDKRIAGLRADDKLDKLSIYWEVGDKPSVKKFLANDLVRALFHENLDTMSGTDKFFSHYLRMSYPDDYPQWYVDLAEKNNIRIAQFENSRDLEIARRIYA